MASMLRVQLHFLQEGGIPLPKALLTAKGTAEQAVVPSETEWSSILLERNNTKKKKKAAIYRALSMDKALYYLT